MTGKRTLTVGLVGYKFMGKAHSNAWRQAPRFFELPTHLRLKAICGRDAKAVREAAGKFGWETAVTNWHTVIDDPEIDIIDICTPNDSHAEIAIAAAKAGKAILCEKPLARNVAEAEKMVHAVKQARVVNMICHNYRRIPAIALAKQMIERGELGERIFHFRARYAQDWIVDPKFPLVWRLRSDASGSGALGDLGSHIVDLARYLVGEFREVCATTETFVKRRPLASKRESTRKMGRVTVDDAVMMIGRFKNGALASLEATRFASGRKNSITLEINGNGGSLFFDLEEMNRLKFFSVRERKDRQGSRHHRHRADSSIHRQVVAAWSHHRLRAHLYPHHRRFRESRCRCNGGTDSVPSWKKSDVTEDVPPANVRRWFPKSTCAGRPRSQRT